MINLLPKPLDCFERVRREETNSCHEDNCPYCLLEVYASGVTDIRNAVQRRAARALVQRCYLYPMDKR